MKIDKLGVIAATPAIAVFVVFGTQMAILLFAAAYTALRVENAGQSRS